MDKKKIIKPIHEITNLELLQLFRIAKGSYDNNYSLENVQRWSSTEIMVTLGMSKYNFGIVICDNQNDVRLGIGHSFIMKEYLSKNNLLVSNSGIEEKREDFLEEKFVLVLNQDKLFRHLEYLGYL